MDSSGLLKLTHPNMRGEKVLTVQKALINLGYTGSNPDGIFGPNTEAAVKQFQKENNLSVDGIVGPNTMDKLQHL